MRYRRNITIAVLMTVMYFGWAPPTKAQQLDPETRRTMQRRGEVARRARRAPIRSEQQLANQLGPETRQTMQRRGEIARQARRAPIRSERQLANQLGPETRQTMQRRGEVARQARRAPIRSERQLANQLGPETRQTLERRGEVARNGRRGTQTASRSKVRFDNSSRRSGAGYNNTRYDGKVAQPKSILKGSPGNRAVAAERQFVRDLGSETRGTMRQRGDVARHGRRSGQVKSTLNNVGRAQPGGKPGGVKVGAAARGLAVGMVANDVLGTDPLDLAIKGVGDIIYGTDNFSETINGIPDAFDQSLVKQMVEDPEAGMQRVAGDLQQTKADIENVINDPGAAAQSALQDTTDFLNDPLGSIFQP